jgi:dephospho-CoA kinase
MLEKIKSIIEQANADYVVEYDEGNMFNIRADAFTRGTKYAYIEEFKEGEIDMQGFFEKDKLRLNIYFSVIPEQELNAIGRELIRERIKSEIVKPFIKAFIDSPHFSSNKLFKYYYPLSRFDANEVSVMIDFECELIENNC